MNTPRMIRLLPVLLLSAASSFAQSDYVTTVENTPGLLGYWRFTPTSQANSEVNGYTGTFNGNAAVGSSSSGPSLADDPQNRPVVLHGNGDWVNTNLVGGTDTGGSIVGWFNLAQLPSDAGHTFYIAGESQYANDFDLQIETDNSVRFYTTGSGAVIDPAPLTSANLGQWIFVAATFTANNTRDIYINGNLVASNASGGHSASSGTFSMGESTVFSGRFFNGALDEMAVYNRQLTATEVQNIYASTAVVPEPSMYGFMLLGALLLLSSWRWRKSRAVLALAS